MGLRGVYKLQVLSIKVRLVARVIEVLYRPLVLVNYVDYLIVILLEDVRLIWVIMQVWYDVVYLPVV